MNAPVNVLFIEDNPGDARLVKEELRLAGSSTIVQLEWVDRLEKGLERLASNHIEAVLLDLSLPDSEGLDTLRRVLTSAPSIPVIVMTGQADEAVAMQAVQAGAQDYLIKGHVDGRLLTRSIQYAIQRKQTEEALRESEERFRLVVQSAPSAMIVVDKRGNITLANTHAEKLFGYSAHELLGQPVELLVPQQFRKVHSHLHQNYLAQPQAIAIGKRQSLYGLQQDGHEIPLEIGLAPYQSSEGLHVLALINDLTERKRAETALQEKEHLLSEAQRIGRIGSWSYAIERGTLQFSEEMYRLLDVAAEDFPHTREGLLGLIYSADRSVMAAWVEEIRAGKQVREPDFRLFCRNGELRYIQCRGRVEFDYNGKPERFIGTMQDITERKLAEIQIRQQIEHLNALRRIDRAIISSFNLHSILETFLSQVITELQVDAAVVLLLNPEKQTLEIAARQGFRSQAPETARLPIVESHAGRVARERRLIKIENLKDQPGDPLLTTVLAGEGFVCYYGVPLIAKGEVQGVLEIFHRVPLRPYPEWLDFLNTLAGQAAIAIENATLFENLQDSNRELSQAYDATIEGWSRALDLRDKETEGHTLRVTALTLNLARSFGFNEEELRYIRWGALLHDIGKMGVPDHILLKPEALTEAELAIMGRHAQYAFDLLKPIAFLQPALDIPYCHHEKWDGTGYPRGLKGEGIPMAARLFAIVDVWDALTSDRPYRSAWSQEQALTYIREQSGRHFDPQVVDLFFKLLK
jgi:PAS domain S-box-containing protein/putative nucleotidyltransferase with HDIG domain